eukprot:197118_1
MEYIHSNVTCTEEHVFLYDNLGNKWINEYHFLVILLFIGICIHFLQQTPSNRLSYYLMVSFCVFKTISLDSFTFSPGLLALPARLDRDSVCGAYYAEENSVYFFSGNEITKYNVDANIFYILPDSPVNFACVGQPITTIDDIIYSATMNTNTMISYNITMGSFNTNFTSIPRVKDSGNAEYHCFANINNKYLFVLGESDNADTSHKRAFRIFDLNNHTWFFGPDTLMDIVGASCTVLNNHLYVVGGDNTRSVIKIDISDIENIENYYWMMLTLSQSLSNSIYPWASRIAVHKDEKMIYYVGPQTGIVDAIDTNTDIIYNNVAVSINAAWYAPVIIQNNRMLIFGGMSGICCGSSSSIWQFATLQTSTPTSTPTYAPTILSIPPTTTPTNCQCLLGIPSCCCHDQLQFYAGYSFYDINNNHGIIGHNTLEEAEAFCLNKTYCIGIHQGNGAPFSSIRSVALVVYPSYDAWAKICITDSPTTAPSIAPSYLTSTPSTSPTTAPLGINDQIHIWSVNNQFIWVGPKRVDWYSANTYCINNFATELASIHNDNQSQEISMLCYTQLSPSECWIGLNDIDSESTYKWIDGSPVDYPIKWNSGSPDNNCGSCGDIEEDCVVLAYNPIQLLIDAACSHPVQYYTFICNAPTLAPTSTPSYVPSISPSTQPTTAPTQPPTTTPTSFPSDAPSISPSTSPTTSCVDYKQNSNDGNNEIRVDINMILDVNNYDFNTLNASTFVASKILSYSGAVISCMTYDCLIKCNDVASCSDATIEINNIQNKSVVILCDQPYSCGNAWIYTKSLVLLSNISIICKDKYSCTNMKIDIRNITAFQIYCIESSSCLDVNISIDSDNNDVGKINDGIINCIMLNACDNLMITTTSNQTQLIMYQHSEDVILNNNIGYLYDKNNIQCNNDRYIRVQSNELMSTQYFSNLIQMEYETDLLPCSDVKVFCGNYSCSMTYHYHPSLTTFIVPDSGCYWLNIQEIQNIICAGECISSPTSRPTSSPTSPPTNVTIPPSFTPTNAPTFPPSFTPTDTPSFSPTFLPSYTPSFSPTFLPSHSPTFTPTNTPSYTPSNTPSENPSTSPTNTPTFLPTNVPTRFPTENYKNIYDSFIDIIYVINGLHISYIIEFEDNTLNVLSEVIEIIESKYFVDNVVEYKDFMIKVKDINGFEDLSNINLKKDHDIKLNSQIICGSDVNGVLLKTSKQPEFDRAVTLYLRKYIFKNNTNLQFYVDGKESLQIYNETLNKTSESQLIIIFSVLIVCMGLIASLFIKWSNKKSDGKVDNARWRAPLLFAFQIYDFISDINLCYDIFNNDLIHSGDLRSTIILWCGIFAALFTALPFISNMIYGIRIKKQKVIQNNRRADEYFTANMAVFMALIVMSGGCHPSLLLVSSNIFGLNAFQSGLTKPELNKLTKIKIKSTITLENGPQLIVQIIYATQTSNISTPIFLAFIGSFLSIILAISSYFANRENRKNSESKSYYVRFCNENGTKLDVEQEKNIQTNKGRTDKLQKAISKVFGVSHDNIEIGYVWVRKDGVEMYISHYLSKSEMSKYNQNNRGYMSMITPKQYLTNVYTKMKAEINKTFRTHFDIQDEDFIVELILDDYDTTVVGNDDNNIALALTEGIQLTQIVHSNTKADEIHEIHNIIQTMNVNITHMMQNMNSHENEKKDEEIDILNKSNGSHHSFLE